MKKLFTLITAFSITIVVNAQVSCVTETIMSIASTPSVISESRSVNYLTDIYVLGGSNTTTQVASNYKYSTTADTWTTLANIPTARAEVGAAEVNGKIYCLGGWTGSVSNKNEAYDIAANTWTTLANLPVGITGCDAVSLNNKVYVFGGTLGTTVSYFYEYNPTTNTYSALALPTQNRMQVRLVVNANKIYLVGGGYFNGSNITSNLFDEYDPGLNTWTSKAPLPVNLQRSSAAMFYGKLYVLGGTNIAVPTTPTNTIYSYSFSANTWSIMPTLPISRAAIDATSLNNEIYFFGGVTSTVTLATNLSHKYYCFSTTGINELAIDNSYKAYPNPFNENVIIEIKNNYINAQVKLFDVTGKEIYSSRITREQTLIDLKSLTSGIYILEVDGKKRKLVKE